jgi:hypothetical protein
VNIGEDIVACYLEYIKKCEFIQRNLYTTDSQGEIDVVGINLKEKRVYVCEVAIHLITGLQYTRDKRPDNVNKLFKKFSKDIEYATKYFDGYDIHIMLWSPIVRNQREGAKHNQIKDVQELSKKLKDKYHLDLDLIINQHFLECLTELREFAKRETKDVKSPILRFLQVEEYLKKRNKSKRNAS